MTINILPTDNFVTIWQKVRGTSESELTLVIPTGHLLLDNSLTLKLLKKEGEAAGKIVSFISDSEGSNSFLSSLFGPLELDSSISVVPEKKTRLDVLKSLKKRLKTPKFVLLFGSFVLFGVLLIGGLFVATTFIPRATVSLKFSQDTLTKNIVVNLSTTETAINSATQILPAEKIVLYATYSGQLATTGEKIEGDYARGKVTIYNKTDSQKSFSEGTMLSYITTSSGSWYFTLDKDVAVPERKLATTSATPGGEVTSYTYGQAKVAVTAKAYGDKYNLLPDSQFTIGDESSSDFLAKNEESLSGGREVTVKVVTVDDQTKLGEEVQTRLVDLLSQQLSLSVPPSFISAASGASIRVIGQNFDRGVGEKADTLNLTATAEATAFVFKEDDLKKLWQELILTNLPSNYSLSETEKQVDISFLTDTLETNRPQLVLKGTSYVVPKYLTEDIQDSLAGKSISQAKDYLGSLPNIESYKINVWPRFLGLGDKLPRIAKNITVTLEK